MILAGPHDTLYTTSFETISDACAETDLASLDAAITSYSVADMDNGMMFTVTKVDGEWGAWFLQTR